MNGKGLMARLAVLEQQSAPELAYVRTMRADGSEAPLQPGQRYAPCIVDLPAVCATSQEWIKRCEQARA